MPRQLRIEYPGAIYHLMNRGARREPIFHDDFDRQRCVTTLGDERIAKLQMKPDEQNEFNLERN